MRCLDGGSSPPISTGKTDHQSIIGISTILNALFGVVFILLYQSVLNFCVVLVCHPGFFSEIHLHLRVRERALMVATPDISPFSRQSRPSSRQAHVIPILRLCWHFPGTKLNSLTANLVHPLQTILPILTEISSSHLTSLLNRQSRPSSSDNLAIPPRNLILLTDISL